MQGKNAKLGLNDRFLLSELCRFNISGNKSIIHFQSCIKRYDEVLGFMLGCRVMLLNVASQSSE